MSKNLEAYFRCRPLTVKQAARICRVSHEAMKSRLRYSFHVQIEDRQPISKGQTERFNAFQVILFALEARLIADGISREQAREAVLAAVSFYTQSPSVTVDGLIYLCRESVVREQFMIFFSDPDGKPACEVAKNEGVFGAILEDAMRASHKHSPVVTVCNLGALLLSIVEDMEAMERTLAEKEGPE